MKKSIPILSLIGLITISIVAAAEPEPATLKTIMGGLKSDMANVHDALWSEDYEALQSAARSVADHPHVSPNEHTRIQAALGPDFAAFAFADRAVHDAALRLSDAAKAEDLEQTLLELAAVQNGCVACHTSFRARLSVTP